MPKVLVISSADAEQTLETVHGWTTLSRNAIRLVDKLNECRHVYPGWTFSLKEVKGHITDPKITHVNRRDHDKRFNHWLITKLV